MTLLLSPDRRDTRILFPSSAEDAAMLAARHQAPYIAGASAAQLGWNKTDNWPEQAISLQALDELRGCQRTKDHWSIGALTRLSELSRNHALCEDLPALHDALLGVGAPGIRHIATLGGNIGFAGDLLPTLLVLDAQIDWLQSGAALQQGALSDWLSQQPRHALITRIRIPIPDPEQRVLMEKLSSREAFNPPLLNIASSWHLRAPAELRLAAGGTGLMPRRLRHCEQALIVNQAQPLTGKALMLPLARDLPELTNQPLLPVAANLLQAQWSESRP
ncbi:MAG: FAD binding domain-containing protein [Pseudomonadaceae bacterium]